MNNSEFQDKLLCLELVENTVINATRNLGENAIVEVKSYDMDSVSITTASGTSWCQSIWGDSPIAIAYDVIKTVYNFEVWGKAV